MGFRSGQDYRIEEFRINDIPSYWIEAPGAADDEVILFFHGGGFTIGSTRDHADLCARLSAAAGAKVLSIDYRLAPEHTFPAALEDCVGSYKWLLNEGYLTSDIVPMGISAAGNLALAMLLYLRDSGFSFPSLACCMYLPWTCCFRVVPLRRMPERTGSPGKGSIPCAQFISRESTRKSLWSLRCTETSGASRH